MRTIQKSVYTFDELSESAKEKARDWYRQGIVYEASDMFESFETAAKLLGITLARTDDGPDIRYTGFCSQGDGASFVGSYEFAKGCGKAVRAEFGDDPKLYAIADGLTVLHTRYLLAYGTTLVATITQDGRSYHKYTMQVDVNEADGETGINDDDANEFRELMRDFAQWIYDGLEAEYEYQNSEECVDQNISDNEYEFDENGERV